MRPRSSALLLLCWVLTASADEGAALQGYLDGLNGLYAEFRQASGDQGLVQDGQLWIEKPGKFAVVTRQPGEQWLVSDGTDLWNFDADLEQVVITRLGDDPAEVPILLFASDAARVTEAYAVTSYSDEAMQHFVLTPRDGSSLFRTVNVAFNEGLPAWVTINPVTGEPTTLQIINAERDPEIEPSRFTFVAPPGIDVLDDR